MSDELSKAAQAALAAWNEDNNSRLYMAMTGIRNALEAKQQAEPATPKPWVFLDADDLMKLPSFDYDAPQGIAEDKFARAVEQASRAKNAVPERVPMTDAEQTALYLLAICKLKTVPTYSDIIRAAEAHHGIKEQK